MKQAAAEKVLGAPSMRWLTRLPTWRGVLTLAYHRIRADEDEMPYGPWVFSATSGALDAQMAFVSKRFEVVSPELIGVDSGARGRRIAVTFDDGYRDNYELALPILRRHGIPAAFFLATGFLDRPRVPWWDELAWMAKQSRREAIDLRRWGGERLALEEDRTAAARALTRVYKALPTEDTDTFLEACAEISGVERLGEGAGDDLWMTWEMAAELRDAGMVIGGHTANHPVLGRSAPELQRTEIAECRRRLAEELGVPLRVFAYPVGQRQSFDRDTRAILGELGVELAFSLYGGYQRRRDLDPLDVPRASVALDTSERGFSAMLRFPGLFARW